MSRIDSFNQYWQAVNTRSPESMKQWINLGMGMPDPTYFTIPLLLRAKLHEAIDENDFTLYCPPAGTQELLETIVRYENTQLTGGSSYTVANAMLTPSAITGFSLIVDALVGPDEHILTQDPTYFSLAALAEIKADLETSTVQSLTFDLDMLLGQVTPKTKLIALCNPNNPTGLFIPPTDLAALIQFTGERGITVVIDESCRNYIYDPGNGALPNNITASHVIRIKGFSKEQNFAGYRIGLILAQAETIAALTRTSPVLYGNPTLMANRALLADYQIKSGILKDSNYTQVSVENLARMRTSRDVVYARLKASPLIEQVLLPEACYYLFARCRFSEGSQKLSAELVDKARLDVCPGTFFGMPPEEAWIRICFARRPEVLEEGIGRILQFLGNERT